MQEKGGTGPHLSFPPRGTQQEARFPRWTRAKDGLEPTVKLLQSGEMGKGMARGSMTLRHRRKGL